MTLANDLQELYDCGQVLLISFLSSSSGGLQISQVVLSTLTGRGGGGKAQGKEKDLILERKHRGEEKET